MKKLVTALAGAAMLSAVTALAAPAGAAVMANPAATFPAAYSRPPACYGQYRGAGRDCTDESRPQHDGNGSLLF